MHRRFWLDVIQDGAIVAYYTETMKAVENVSGALTTLIWDGTDYLQGRS